MEKEFCLSTVPVPRHHFLLALTVITTLYTAAAAAKDTPPADNIVLGNDKVSLTVTPEGRFVSIRDNRIGADFVSQWAHEGNAWVAWLPDEKILTAAEAGPADCKVHFVAGVPTLSMHWKPAEQSAIGVQCTVRLVGDDQFEFSATLSNGPDATEVQQFCFPAHFGWEKSTDGWIMLPAKNSGMCYPFDAVKPTQFNGYPANQIMQLVGIRHGRTAAAIYANDTQGFSKFAMLDTTDSHALLNYKYAVWVNPGETYKAPFSFVVKLIPDADQTALCKAYRRWSLGQWWFSKKNTEKLRRTTGLSAMWNGYVRLGGIVWAEADGEYCPRVHQTIEDRIATIRDLRENYDFNGGAWSPGFSWMFDSRYPDYFPIHHALGTEEDFLLFNELLNAWGVPVMYHMNPINWNDYSPSFRKEWIATWRGSSGYTHISPPAGTRRFYFMSPLVSIHKDLHTIARMIEQFHAGGFYFDMIGHTFMSDDNPLAGYPPETIGRNNLGQMKKEVFDRIRAQAPSQVLMTEIGNEMTLPQLDMCFGGDITALQVDISEAFAYPAMWQMVYSDAIVRTWSWRDNIVSRNLQALIGSNYCWQNKPKVYDAHVQMLVSRQKVMRKIIGTEMLRFDKDEGRMSSTWPAGLAVMALDDNGRGEIDSPIGTIAWSNMKTDDLLMVTADDSFIARDIAKLTCNGEVLLSGRSDGVEIINHPGDTTFINPTFTPSDVDVLIRPAGGKKVTFATLQVNANKARTPWQIETDSGLIKARMTIPPRSTARLRWVSREQLLNSAHKAIKVQLGHILTSLESLPENETRRRLIDRVTTLHAMLANDPATLTKQLQQLRNALSGLPVGSSRPVVSLRIRPVKRVTTYLSVYVGVLDQGKSHMLGSTILGGHYGKEPRDIIVDLTAFAGRDVSIFFEIPSSDNQLTTRAFGIFEPCLARQMYDEHFLPAGPVQPLMSLLPSADTPGLRAFVPGPDEPTFQQQGQTLPEALKDGYIRDDAFITWPIDAETIEGIVPSIPLEYTREKRTVINGTSNVDAYGRLYYIQNVKVPPLDYVAEIDRIIRLIAKLPRL